MTDTQAEWTSKVEQSLDYVWNQRRHEVEGELTWTLNLLDRVEDDTRRLYERMLRETKSTYGGPSIREIETETLYALDDIYES